MSCLHDLSIYVLLIQEPTTNATRYLLLVRVIYIKRQKAMLVEKTVFLQNMSDIDIRKLNIG